MNEHIIAHNYKVSSAERAGLMGHKPCVIWFTGLSGSGKSTLADATEEMLIKKGIHTYHLDGDKLRKGLNSNLDFSAEGRSENIRRTGETARLMADAGLVVLCAIISPFKKDREQVRTLNKDTAFIEVFVDCPIEVCEQRDIKGLYKKARAGEIKDFTGINSPYERPENPDIRVDTSVQSIAECLNLIEEKVLKNIRL